MVLRQIRLTSKQQINLHHFHCFMIGRKGSKFIKICKILQISVMDSLLMCGTLLSRHPTIFIFGYEDQRKEVQDGKETFPQDPADKFSLSLARLLSF